MFLFNISHGSITNKSKTQPLLAYKNDAVGGTVCAPSYASRMQSQFQVSRRYQQSQPPAVVTHISLGVGGIEYHTHLQIQQHQGRKDSQICSNSQSNCLRPCHTLNLVQNRAMGKRTRVSIREKLNANERYENKQTFSHYKLKIWLKHWRVLISEIKKKTRVSNIATTL